VKLYGYWRSSATWRVRIALEYKGLAFDYVPVHLIEGGGQHRTEWYKQLNPSTQVPTLTVDLDGTSRNLGQSMAILEFLEEAYPQTPMLPSDPFLRARTRQLAEIVNSGIQPLQNLSVLNHLKTLDVDSKAWSARWIEQGLRAFQAIVLETGGTFCVGDHVTWADAVLIPQLYNARRFDVKLDDFARLLEIEKACEALPAFQRAHANAQPDAQP
jgi:maleylpyruvate isomerase